MDSSITGVSQALSDLEFRPLTWENTVSEGGLEPPCPLRALAPQASASAYSATRTRDARGTHRLSYLSKPNAPKRVPRPVNLAARVPLASVKSRRPQTPDPQGQP